MKEHKLTEQLIELGRTHYQVEVSRGAALGSAIAPYFGRNELLEMCGEALEDNNWHAMAAKVRALISQ
jgi:hypothetical protein